MGADLPGAEPRQAHAVRWIGAADHCRLLARFGLQAAKKRPLVTATLTRRTHAATITFTVSDLLDELQQFDPDAEVRLATQPSWPFEWSLSNTDPAVEVDLDGQPVVYLVEDKQLGYLPGAVREELGW